MTNDRDIFLERARSTALKASSVKASSHNIINVVEFNLLSDRYAFEESYVSEILFLKELTPIPGTPSFVLGVISYRSKILSIINLKSLFNLKGRGISDLNKVIVLDNGINYFGVVTDTITGIREVDLNSLSQPPVNLDTSEMEFISGVLPDGLILLNANKILTSSTIIIKQ